MSHIAVSGIAYAHPGGDELFSEISFTIAPGRHVGLVGANGVGKSTLMRVIAGELEPVQGDVDVTRAAYMAQNVGIAGGSVRDLLLTTASPRLRAAGEAMAAAERDLAAGADPAEAGIRMGEAIAVWSELGGYELEGAWDAACRAIVRAPLTHVEARDAVTLSGGERKRLILEVLFTGDAPVLLLDEPDNFLDLASKLALEQRIRQSKKTVLLISHDRDLLGAACDSILTLEANDTWLHGGSYHTYAAARQARQERLGDRLDQWKREERRLFHFYKTMKQRASISDVLAKRAAAAETRWQRFVDAGPPPAPVVDHEITPRIRGGDSARIVVALRSVGIDGLVLPFEDEIRFGERVGLIGPNGSGKSHLLNLLAGQPVSHSGELRIGNRVSAGLFTQLGARADFAGRTVMEIAEQRTGAVESAMRALARYGLQQAARRATDTLSGGQMARLEILCLELEQHNLLLLDEPTDNLDIDSSEALETALESFTGTVVSVSHDRAFLRGLDRFLFLGHDGAVYELPDAETALGVLADPESVAETRFAKRL